MVVDLMADKRQQDRLPGPLTKEIEEFIDFKRQSGSVYTSSEFALKAFDRFCAAVENQALTPQLFPLSYKARKLTVLPVLK